MDRNSSVPGPAERGVGRGRPRLARVIGCLGWRLVILLTACLVLLLGASSWWALELHRKHLVSLLEANVLGLGETILYGTHSSMMANDRDQLAGIIENIGRREEVHAIRLLDARGTIQFSDRREEIGLRSDPGAPACQGCHGNGTPRAPATLREGLRLYRMAEGQEALGLGAAVLNAPECWNAPCHVHPREQKVLGMLDVELSTAGLQASMADARGQMVLLGLLTIVIACSAVGLVTWRVVHRPLHTILFGIRSLGSGDLTHRIARIPPGELGELATSFNEMSARLQTAQGELDDWNRTLERRVQEKTEELERTRDQMVFTEKMASLGKLAAIVAHEINNPLAGVLVYAKLLRRTLARSEATDARADTDEKLAVIERETARCGDIVRNLLLFSRKDQSTKSPASLNTVLGNSVKLVQHQADLQGVTVVQELEPTLPDVVCDAAEIQQAVLAVIMNGLEAMPEGGVLTVRSRIQDAGTARLEIEDTGIGIPEELRGRIFEPFFSTKPRGKGTGLGLAVMYGIVQRHQGSVSYDSRPGRGTVFRIDLPRKPDSGPPAAEILGASKGGATP